MSLSTNRLEKVVCKKCQSDDLQICHGPEMLLIPHIQALYIYKLVCNQCQHHFNYSAEHDQLTFNNTDDRHSILNAHS